jgi:hypothetical protein
VRVSSACTSLEAVSYSISLATAICSTGQRSRRVGKAPKTQPSPQPAPVDNRQRYTRTRLSRSEIIILTQNGISLVSLCRSTDSGDGHHLGRDTVAGYTKPKSLCSLLAMTGLAEAGDSMIGTGSDAEISIWASLRPTSLLVVE